MYDTCVYETLREILPTPDLPYFKLSHYRITIPHKNKDVQNWHLIEITYNRHNMLNLQNI